MGVRRLVSCHAICPREPCSPSPAARLNDTQTPQSKVRSGPQVVAFVVRVDSLCTLFFRFHGWYDLSCSRRMESYPIGRDQTDQVCRQCSRWNPRVNSTQPGTRHYNGCHRWCFHTVLVGIVRTASWHRHRGRIALARTACSCLLRSSALCYAQCLSCLAGADRKNPLAASQKLPG